MKKTTLLVGAEGVAEDVGRIPGVRMADAMESSWAEAQLKAAGMSPASMAYDKMGRPYFWVTVTDEAPPEIWGRASKSIRVLRLEN